MVLDPLSAIGLAGNIVTFIQFGCSLLSDTREIHNSASSSLAETFELENISAHLNLLLTKLQPSDLRISDDESFVNILNSCQHIATEICEALQQIGAKYGHHRKWDSFRKALSSLWHKEKIASLKKRLNSLRHQLLFDVTLRASQEQRQIREELEELSRRSISIDVDRRQEIQEVQSKLDSTLFNQARLVTKEDLDRLSMFLENAILKTNIIARETQILEALCFDTITIRHDRIPEAYEHTYDWVFNSTPEVLNNARPTVQFSTWLEAKGGIFWVSGKPGSGKSTLMKHICDDPRTQAKLQQWAAGSRLSVASFYFWNVGTEMQKSQKGLLQSLLYEILSSCLHLIPTVCPSRWSSQTPSTSAWGLRELRHAFRALENCASDTHKFCFFIDGLDEFEGDCFELLDIMISMVKSPYIKLCASSRPWAYVEDALRGYLFDKVCMQDLTRTDIEVFVKGKLRRLVDQNFSSETELQYDMLARQIVRKAEGVFLWVDLVVRSFQQGVVNGDNIAMLQARLETLPADLELFFEHSLRSIDPISQQKASAMFQVALLAKTPLLLLVHSFLDEDDPNFAIQIPASDLDPVAAESRCAEVRNRINRRSKGLLEICTLRYGIKKGQHHVEFSHRTVRDFLKLERISLLLRRMTPPTYNASFCLSRAFLAAFKVLPFSAKDRDENLNQIAKYARIAEEEKRIADIALMTELERTSKIRYELFQQTEMSFLGFTIKKGLVRYVDIQLDALTGLSMEGEYGRLLLNAIMWRPSDNADIDLIPMIERLMDRGLRPQILVRGKSVWNYFLDIFEAELELDFLQAGSWKNFDYHIQLIKLMLSRGVGQVSKCNMFVRVFKASMHYSLGSSLIDKTISVIKLLFGYGLDPLSTAECPVSVWCSFLSSLKDVKKNHQKIIFYKLTMEFLRFGASPFGIYVFKEGIQIPVKTQQELQDGDNNWANGALLDVSKQLGCILRTCTQTAAEHRALQDLIDRETTYQLHLRGVHPCQALENMEVEPFENGDQKYMIFGSRMAKLDD